MMIDGVEVTAAGFVPTACDMKKYVDYCRAHVTEPFNELILIAARNGKVDAFLNQRRAIDWLAISKEDLTHDD